VKFKLDENLPVALGDDFRSLGYDADTVLSEGLCGAEDPVIVEAARTSSRILLTLDRGIANMLWYPLSRHAGLVLFRPDSSGQRAVLSFIRARLPELLKMELADRLTVVGPTRIRVRLIPPS
jgi:predicted nuclease of predicted toxin-antitoxin system